jgi:hypothetical protein
VYSGRWMSALSSCEPSSSDSGLALPKCMAELRLDLTLENTSIHTSHGLADALLGAGHLCLVNIRLECM